MENNCPLIPNPCVKGKALDSRSKLIISFYGLEEIELQAHCILLRKCV